MILVLEILLIVHDSCAACSLRPSALRGVYGINDL
jgi:hypothetical protein